MTTTAAAIRDKMITTVEALTPTVSSGERFRLVVDDDGEFRNWADMNPVAALRRFAIYELGTIRPPEVSSTVEQWTDEDFECVLAYPRKSLSRYGAKAFRSLMDTIKSDQKQIEDAIGTNGYQSLETSAVAVVTSGEWRLEKSPACLFGVLPLRVQYWRAM